MIHLSTSADQKQNTAALETLAVSEVFMYKYHHNKHVNQYLLIAIVIGFNYLLENQVGDETILDHMACGETFLLILNFPMAGEVL